MTNLTNHRATPRQATSAVAYTAPPPDEDDPLLAFDPVPHTRPRRNSITPDLQRAFIAHLAATGIVKEAALHIGKSLEAICVFVAPSSAGREPSGSLGFPREGSGGRSPLRPAYGAPNTARFFAPRTVFHVFHPVGFPSSNSEAVGRTNTSSNSEAVGQQDRAGASGL